MHVAPTYLELLTFKQTSLHAVQRGGEAHVALTFPVSDKMNSFHRLPTISSQRLFLSTPGLRQSTSPPFQLHMRRHRTVIPLMCDKETHRAPRPHADPQWHLPQEHQPGTKPKHTDPDRHLTWLRKKASGFKNRAQTGTLSNRRA